MLELKEVLRGVQLLFHGIGGAVRTHGKDMGSENWVPYETV